MKLRQFTVMFELEGSDAPITFEQAIRMAVRQGDKQSCSWLNNRIRRMVLLDTKTLEE